MRPGRKRGVLASVLAAAACLSGTTVAQANKARQAPDPIIFVHGNGDDASRWIPIIWLFETNGYPADRLSAIRFHNPVARTDDTHDEADRSSTAQSMQELSSFVQDMLRRTHARKVVLVGSSRGGLTIRNYIQNGGGKDVVSAEILCGTPNHGVNVSASNLGGEFNGGGTFLSALNTLNEQKTEVTSGVRALTLRSDRLDKYAQPTGIALGRPEAATGVSFEGPSLVGAENVVLPGKDHRELAFSDEAFAVMYRFITGGDAKTLQIRPEQKVVVSGLITGFGGAAATNDPLSAVHVRVAEVRSQGEDHVVYDKITDNSGAWGPVQASSNIELSFDLESHGRHVVYFLPPLSRTTTLLNFRLLPAPAVQAMTPGKRSFLVLRPNGYFSRDRDPVLVNGTPAASEPQGFPIRDAFVVETADSAQTARVALRKEEVTVKPSDDQKRVQSVVEFLR